MAISFKQQLFLNGLSTRLRLFRRSLNSLPPEVCTKGGFEETLMVGHGDQVISYTNKGTYWKVRGWFIVIARITRDK